MAKTIQQSVKFKAKAAKVYALYADSKQHTAVTGKKASVGAKAGGRVSAQGGAETGKLLQVVKNKMIVQTWRAKDWKKTDQDSVLVMTFEDTPTGASVKLVQANVPDHKAAAVTKSWRASYFDRWTKHFADTAKPAKKAAAKKPAKKAAAKKPAKKAAAKKPARKAAAARAPRR